MKQEVLIFIRIMEGSWRTWGLVLSDPMRMTAANVVLKELKVMKLIRRR